MHIARDYIEMVVRIDAVLAVKMDKALQLGILAAIRDKKTKKVNIMHFTSCKSKRVRKSVLATELIALVDEFDVGYSITFMLNEKYQKDIELKLYRDSHPLYELCTSLT